MGLFDFAPGREGYYGKYGGAFLPVGISDGDSLVFAADAKGAYRFYALTTDALRHVTTRLAALADRHAGGRLLVLGGGGYEKKSLPAGWCAVVEALLDAAPA